MVVRSAQQPLVANPASSYWRWFGGYCLFAPGRPDLHSHH